MERLKERKFERVSPHLYGRSSQCSTTGVTNAVGMCHPVCGMMHIKEPLLLIGKSSSCDGNGFPLSLSEWSFIMSDVI